MLFRSHLIKELEVSYALGVSHKTLKLEHLSIDKDGKLKLARTKCSCPDLASCNSLRGFPNYRSPEVKARTCADPEAADIYSAGIILFAFRCGTLPYDEEKTVDGTNLFGALHGNQEDFWKYHESRGSLPDDPDFKDLFLSMVRTDPEKRISLEEIKSHKYFLEPVYEDAELRSVMHHGLKVTCHLKKKSLSL